jgi:hypothetical protein
MSCAAVQVLYPGNGQQSDFLITFEYDFKSDVKVALWNSTTKEYDNLTEYSSGLADGTYYKYMEATIIRLVDQDDNPFAPRTPTVDPELGIAVPNIKIYRDTDITPMRATFYPGSSIRAQDLNSNFDQLRDALQESRCDLDNVEIWVDERFWNKTTDTVSSTETWVSDDAHIATTAAGDDRWLGIPGGGGTTITGGSGIEMTGNPASVVEVDLADTTPGLQFDANDDLQVIGNSVTEDGGNVRLTNGPSNVTVTGGANVTVTRNSAAELTIAAPAVTGGSTFRGTVDVDNDNTLPATTGQQNPNAVSDGDAFTVENNVAAADVTANWNTVLDNWDTADGIINSGDVILCTTGAAAGSPTDARYNLIRTGGNVNTLQQVTDAGNTTTNDIVLDDSTLQIQEGTDTLTVDWPTGTANRTISFPDASGTIALAGAGGDPWVLDTAATPDTITAQGTDATVVIPSGNITTTGNDNIDLDPAGTGTVIFGANATAEADLTVTTNLTVNGNTTLGDADTDTVTVEGTLTCNENVTLNNDTAETTTINGILNFDIGLLTEV